MEYRVGDVFGGLQVEPGAFADFIVDKYDVAQHRKQQLSRAADHPAIDKRRSGRGFKRDFEAAGFQ